MCGRCWEIFDNKNELNKHLRLDERCETKAKPHFDGFDEGQEAALRSRKRANLQGTEFEKWRKVFKILFPHVTDDEIPSPCEFPLAGLRRPRKHDLIFYA